MDNFVGRLIGGAHEETIPLDVARDQTPDLQMIASDECAPSVNEVALTDCGQERSSSEPETEYKSARVEEMMQSRSQFSSDAEYEIAHSKVHWSLLKDVDDSDEDMNEAGVNRENGEVFLELMNDPRWIDPLYELGENRSFFVGGVSSSFVGQKIAEGGQAEIFEILNLDGTVYEDALLKMFKKGSRISQLRQQWPSGVLQQKVEHIILKGLFFDSGRFAFLMNKCWGDLRKLIDQAMQAKSNRGPPFPFEWNGRTLRDFDIMRTIALLMYGIHKESIVHRDLKASNILLGTTLPYPFLVVADFECSIGVVGTGFWRAPEIMLGLRNKSAIDYSEKVDVYGYAMTCYEIVTGLLPFEGELEVTIDHVIEGRRPKLPNNLEGTLKSVIESCWDHNPLKTPAFAKIWDTLSALQKNRKR